MKRQLALFEEKARCGHREGCTNGEAEPHTCPYQSDVNGDDETLCTCCHSCASECAMDI